MWGAGWGVQPSLGSRGQLCGSRHQEEWQEALAGDVGIMNHREQVSSKDLDLGERKAQKGLLQVGTEAHCAQGGDGRRCSDQAPGALLTGQPPAQDPVRSLNPHLSPWLWVHCFHLFFN